MEFKETIIKRQSIRGYLDKPVSEDKLNRILEAARLAPSASNRQPWKFIVVKDSQKRRELAQSTYGQTFIAQAPVIITAIATDPDYIMPCGIPSYAIDLAIAITQMTLAAADEGLGSCWIGAFSQDKVKEILEVPIKYKVITVLPVGYPKRESMTKTKKSLDEIVCHETFSE